MAGGLASTKIPAKHNPFAAANVAGNASITVGVESTNTITLTCQLQNANGKNVAVRTALSYYFSNDANGDSLITTGHSTTPAIGTNGVLIQTIDKKAGIVVTEADGTFDLILIESGVHTSYLILIMPDGSLKPSGIITFA